MFFLTHLHADFVAGHLELRDRVALLFFGREGESGICIHSISDGEILELARVRLKVLEHRGTRRSRFRLWFMI